MTKDTWRLSSYDCGIYQIDVFRETTFNGFNPKIVEFYVDITRGYQPYELRRFKSRQGAERFVQRFIARNQ